VPGGSSRWRLADGGLAAEKGVAEGQPLARLERRVSLECLCLPRLSQQRVFHSVHGDAPWHPRIVRQSGPALPVGRPGESFGSDAVPSFERSLARVLVPTVGRRVLVTREGMGR
jgi:hypothetical protein